MIVITVKYEKDSEPAKGFPPNLSAVFVKLDNTQVAYNCTAKLRATEAVEHRLRIDPEGIIKLEITGV